MARFNYKEIHRSITNSKVGEKRVRAVWENRLAENKPFLLAEFDNHAVTKEIEAGPHPDVKNISETLNGQGNLFSFLGFEAGSNPTKQVRDVLENDIRLSTGVKREAKSDRARFRFSLRIPTQEINAAAKMTWESGKSWVNAVQQGVSGFSHYLWKKFIGDKSRSFYGIQVKHEVREAPDKSTGVSYINQIFDNFVSRLKK